MAQLLLYKVEKVRSGRAGKDLYATLKEEIDAGREFIERLHASWPVKAACWLRAAGPSSFLPALRRAVEVGSRPGRQVEAQWLAGVQQGDQRPDG